jgi:hypothetical protein
MKKLTTEQIKKAVNWWADVIRSPKFDNGDKSSAGEMGFMLATMARDKCEPTADQIVEFKKQLGIMLEVSENLPYEGLHCDYHPEHLLCEAAEKSGISELNFPWKTSMWFRDGKVTVAYGYAQKPVEI